MSKITTASPDAPVRTDLIVSTLDQEPYIFRKVIPSGEVQYHGFLVDLLEAVSKKAGFTFSFKQAFDGQYGSLRPDGWTGVIGDVVSGKADIGGAALTVTPQREEAVDFTKSYLTNSVNLLVQKPSWIDLGLGYLVRPFSVDYWILFLVVLFLVGLVFFIIGHFSPYEWGNVAADRDPRAAKNSFSLRNSYLFALSTLTWQGFREAPHSISGRIMAGFWWMFVLFTLIAYTANLTVYMISRPEQLPEMPFKTYEDLLASSIRVRALGSGSTYRRLRSSQYETQKSLWLKINNANTWVESYDEGVEIVKSSNGKDVLLMESAVAEYEASKNCELMIYGEDLFPSALAFAVKKGSPWKQKISDAIDQLQQDGTLDQIKDKYWRFAGKCINIDGRKFIESGGRLSSLPIYPVTLKDMSVAILLLFLGFMAAMVFLAIEIAHYAVTKQGKKIEKPQILKNPPKLPNLPKMPQMPKIFKGKNKAAKAGPADLEEGEAGATSDGLESVPLEDAEEAGPRVEESDKPQA